MDVYKRSIERKDSMNLATISGRLCKDPDNRTTASGISVTTFTVAVDRRYKADGQPSVDFINCMAWRNTADFIKKYFHKGDKILLNGSLQVRNWDDKEGKKHTSTEIVVDNAEFCETKKREEKTFIPEDDDDNSLPF